MIDWQLVIVVTVVIVSAGLMLRRVVLWLRGQSSGSCSRCSQQQNSPQSIKLKPLTQISLPKDRR